MSFDSLAPHYLWMERMFAGGLMQQSRTAFIGQTRHCQKALLVGEGHGQFLAALLTENKDIRVTCLENSSQMVRQALALLDRRKLDCGRVDFVRHNALEWSLPQREYDIVVTHYFLDCFRPEQLAGLVGRLSDAATSNSIWLLTDFHVPDHGLRRWRAMLIIKMLIIFFRLATHLPANRLTPPDVYLKTAGFKLAQRREWSWGLVHSDLWLRTVGGLVTMPCAASCEIP